jgi:hypothetical protein
MTDVKFNYGTLIREVGSKLDYCGKWNATLNESVRNAQTNADMTLFIRVHFKKIDPPQLPAGAKQLLGPMRLRGYYSDHDGRPFRIQAWARHEFEHFTRVLLASAQRFWSGVFWLQTPIDYHGLDWPEAKPTHRCNIYCKLRLAQAFSEDNAHYTVALVRISHDQGGYFRSDAALMSSWALRSWNLVFPKSTTKFWTHYHEVGHLIGLGHIGWAGHRNIFTGEPAAYGVTLHDKRDVMGKGSVRRPWHALAWQEAAAEFTGTKPTDWVVHMKHIKPQDLRQASLARAA